MKKKLLLLFICLILIRFNNVSADTWKCAYTGNDGKIKLTYKFDNVNNKMDVTNKKSSLGYVYTYMSYVSDGEVNLLEKNTCPIIHLVYAWISDSSGYDPDTGAGHTMWYYYYSFADSWVREQRKECVNQRDGVFDSKCLKQGFKDFLNIQSTSIDYYSLTLDYDNEVNKNNIQINHCNTYMALMKDLENFYKEFSQNNATHLLISSKEIIDKMTATCGSMFTYRDISVYDGSGKLVPDACVEKCLDFQKELEELQKKYNILSYPNTGSCGFSGKLIQFIGNIIKWVKYIIPVVVIVLGILDFIKAIAGDKEEEIKKAQGKFVKRLIAAALIFIIPFILEFVLNKMGFDANGCGIIDL